MLNTEDLSKALTATASEKAEDERTPSSNNRIKPGDPSRTASDMQPRRSPLSAQAIQLANLLGEPNVNSIQRLIEIFGLEFISQKAEEASGLYSDAVGRGEIAYHQPNTAVATGKSKPRTPGGVFFFLMREHCSNLGLEWNGLRIAPPAWYERKPRKQQGALSPNITGSEPGVKAVSSSATFVDASVQSVKKLETPQAPDYSTSKVRPTGTTSANLTTDSKTNVVSSLTDITSPAPVDDIIEKSPASKGENGPKPTRLKATVVGSLLGRPKVNPNGKEGLVELRFEAEMNSSSLPKGLPDLGGSRVVVWCTKKQFDKVLQQIEVTSQTRFIIEGEPVPAVSADLTPFLRIICTRLTTIELEQKRHLT